RATAPDRVPTLTTIAARQGQRRQRLRRRDRLRLTDGDRLRVGPATGRVERVPADAREVDLDPGVGGAGADRLPAGRDIDLAWQKALGETGRDAFLAEEDRHRAREVLAEADLVVGEAFDRRAVVVAYARDIHAVRVAGRVMELVDDGGREV